MSSNRKTAHIQTLSLSAALKQALLDELSASLSWRSLFEELVRQIGAALERAAASNQDARGGRRVSRLKEERYTGSQELPHGVGKRRSPLFRRLLATPSHRGVDVLVGILPH